MLSICDDIASSELDSLSIPQVGRIAERTSCIKMVTGISSMPMLVIRPNISRLYFCFWTQLVELKGGLLPLFSTNVQNSNNMKIQR